MVQIYKSHIPLFFYNLYLSLIAKISANIVKVINNIVINLLYFFVFFLNKVKHTKTANAYKIYTIIIKEKLKCKWQTLFNFSITYLSINKININNNKVIFVALSFLWINILITIGVNIDFIYKYLLVFFIIYFFLLIIFF